MSVHGEALYEKGLTVSAVCTSCHTSHDILDHNNPASSINRDNVARTCMQCHGRIEEVHVKVIEGRLWESEPHKVPSCVECHQPHKIRRPCVHRRGRGQPRLHEMPRKARAGGGARREAGFAVHRRRGLRAVDAQPDGLRAVPHRGRPEAPRARVRDDYQAGRLRDLPRRAGARPRAQPARPARREGRRRGPGLPRPATPPTTPRATASRPRRPSCATCPDLCGRCHRKGGVAAARIDSEMPDIVESYIQSAHGRGLLDSGLVVSASCIDCHTAHRALAAEDANSSVNRETIADTCGKCHKGIEEQFKTSIHWPGNVVTTEELPTCERLPQLAHDQPGRRAGLPVHDDGPVRALPRGLCRDLLRDLPRQGHAARVRGRRQVLRLPRHPRHPAGRQPGVVAQPLEGRRDLRASAIPGPTASSPAT